MSVMQIKIWNKFNLDYIGLLLVTHPGDQFCAAQLYLRLQTL